MIINFFKGLFYWIRLNFNKFKFNLLRECLKGQPYDYEFLLKIEKAKLEEMLNYFNNSDIVNHDTDIRYIKIAIKLLNILISDGEDLYEFKYNFGEISKDDEIHNRYVFIGNVNMNNISRFLKRNNDIDFVKRFPHEAYLLKAESLYYKIRNEKGYKWWD